MTRASTGREGSGNENWFSLCQFCEVSLEIEEHGDGVFNESLDALEGGDSVASVDDSVVVGEGDVHHWANFDLVVDDMSALVDGVHSQDGRLRRVDDWGSHEGAEDSTV